MDTFITTLTDQTRSLITVTASRYVNTGDRMLDTALNVVVGTILTGLLSLFIHVTYKGGWRTLRYYLPIHTKGQQMELDFEPTMVPVAKTTDLSYYFSNPHGKRAFVRWFNHYLGNKQFKNPTAQFVMPEFSNIKEPAGAKNERMERLQKTYLDRCVDSNTYGGSDSLLPIWYDRTGHYVYMVSDRYNHAAHYYSNNPDAIRRVLKHIDAFNNSLEEKDESPNKQTLQALMMERGSNAIEWDTLGFVDSRATFDTLFFPEKEAYIEMLTRFKERRMYPSHLPIENKLGIMLHGPPGTGKTRLIASTANFLGYGVNMVDMSKVRTKTAFSNLMSDIFGSKSILVLEEFDCVSGILRRDDPQASGTMTPTQAAANSTLTPESMALMMLASSGKDSNDNTWKKTLMEERDVAADQLDLGYLLAKLDGLESNEGRIIIATTNHPERIDPALLRPGRLGLKICLSYATREVARDILCMVFQVTGDDQRADILQQLATMETKRWTPAEILQEAIIRNSMSAMIQFLTATASSEEATTA